MKIKKKNRITAAFLAVGLSVTTLSAQLPVSRLKTQRMELKIYFPTLNKLIMMTQTPPILIPYMTKLR